MEPRKIFMWSFLSILLVSMMSTGCQAQELTEVNASDILEQIENGDDIYLENVRITGELNLNNIELETLPIKRSNLQEATFDLNDELKVVKSKITILYSVFESDVDFSNTQFNEALDFYNTSFTGETDLRWASFIQSTDFQLVKFNDGADFRWAKFYADANFEDASFNYYAMFDNANFNITSFKNVIFDGSTYFSNAGFNGDVKFWHVNFNGFIDFNDVNFNNNNTSFLGVTFSGDTNFRNAEFNKTTFTEAIFNSNTDFINANFNSNTDFTDVNFNKNAKFNNVVFIGEADFNDSTFNDYADFYNVTFDSNVKMNGCKFSVSKLGDGANFMDADFNGDADFRRAKFDDGANFMDADFNGDADFGRAKFGDVDFSRTDFNKNVDFHIIDFQKMVVTWSSLEDGLTCDGLVYIKLIKNFRDGELFDDADKAYYQYRKQSRRDENGFSWLLSIIMELTCGYGVKPLNAVGSGLFLAIILFPIIYMRLGMSFFSALECSCVTFITGYNHEIVKNNKFTNSYRLPKRIVERLPYDFINKKLSWLTHVRLVKFALIFEGLLGWLILALFLVTLANVMIRP